MTYVLDRAVGNGVIVKPDTYREISEYPQAYFIECSCGQCRKRKNSKEGGS